MWVSYSFTHAISPQQKIKMFIFVMPTTMLLSEAIEIETPKTLDTSIIYISLMTIAIYMNIFNIIQIFFEEVINEEKNHTAFISEDIFISYENTTNTSKETTTDEHIQYMIHELRDIIVIGYKSPMHTILTERCEKLPHNRTVLEQHLYHLSCQVPLIYLTPSGNYIPQKA